MAALCQTAPKSGAFYWRRAMKYFLHDTDSFEDEKIAEVFIKFGYEGLGLFYTVLEKLGKQEKPIKTKILKHQLKVGKRLNRCWLFMEEIDLIQSNNGETFNEELLKKNEKYQIKKEKNRKKVSEWRDRQADKKNVTSYKPPSNPSKVNKSKIKKTKEGNTPSEKPTVQKPDFVNDIIDVFKSAYRVARGADYIITNKGKERSAAGKLISVYKNKHPDHTRQQTVQAFIQFFNDCLQLDDPWLHDNMSLPIINSKINEITNQLRNGNKRKTSQAGADPADIARLIADKVGAK